MRFFKARNRHRNHTSEERSRATRSKAMDQLRDPMTEVLMRVMR